MFGKVKLENGSLIPVTISGPTDGSTDIVHHEDNCDYQLATAYDDQYGAGYLGISDCCKPLYNPRTGKLTVDCADTVSTGVDINNNSNTNTTVKVLVQGQDENCLPTTTIEKSNIDYNANCYVCNDPTTGDPVRKPVTHVSTLCVDELLGVASGVDVCITDCECNYPIAAFDAATKTVVIGDTNPILYNPGTGFLSVCGLLSSECNTTGIELDSDTIHVVVGDSALEVDTCDVTISPACSLEVNANKAVVNCLPYTCRNDSHYELFGRNTTTSEVKKLDGFTYDPYTCVMSGRFQGMAFPVICCGEAVGDVCPVSGIGMTSNMLELYHGRKSEGGINFCQFLYMDDNCFEIDSNCGLAYNRLKMCQGCLINTSCYLNNSCTVLTQTINSFGVSICCLTNNKAAQLSLSTASGFRAYGDGYGLRLECDVLEIQNCRVSVTSDVSAVAITNRASKGTLCLGCDKVSLAYADTGAAMYFCKTDCKAYVTDGTNDNRIALMCDVCAVSSLPTITATTLAGIFNAQCGNGPQAVYSDMHASPIALTYCGKTFEIAYIIGTITCPYSGNSWLQGHIRTTDNKGYWASLNIMAGGTIDWNNGWSFITPIPGTMYGTASATGINVEGTV